MSTGISIVRAVYGTSTASTDVTKVVASLVTDGSLKFTVTPNALNVTDPAPGQLKTLTITYTINGGTNNISTTTDSNVVSIDAPPETVASGLQITKAEYGYPGNFTDVTDSIQNQATNGEIDIKISPSSVGIPDPNPNKQKELRVEYTINGKKTSETLKDGKNFKLSAPPNQAVSNTTPSQTVGTLIGMVFKSVAYFFGMFLYTLSIFTAIEYGNQFISPLLWGAMAFFLPFYSFWGLPFITFWIRLFSSADFIH
jgi:hypothetical protein